MRQKLTHFLTSGFLLFGLLLYSGVGWGQIISQYIETSSGTTPKGIEIWNNTGSTIDFSTTNLSIWKGTNGGATSEDVTINTGTLADGSVIVIGTEADISGSGTGFKDYVEGNGATFYTYSFSFNGDDALEVYLDGVKTDVFGDPNTGDPGPGWSGNGVQTYNQNIQLLTGITTGDTDGWTDPSTRFETVSTDNSLTGFGVAPEAASTDEPTWYNLQWPATGTIAYGGTYDVFAQVYEAGVTDAAGQGAGIDAWIGVSTEDTDPSTWTTWIPASYNQDVGNNDEFMANIGSSLPAGTYYYASRFSLNSGPYVYGGYGSLPDTDENWDDDGAWDGTDDVSGVLTVNPPSTTLPYSQAFDADLGDCTNFTVAGTNPWEHSNGSASANGFGGENPEEHWLVLPAIDFDSYSGETMNFTNYARYGTIDANNYLKLFYSSDYTGLGDPSAATWTELSFNKPADGAVETTTEVETASGDIDLSGITGTEVYLAFKYYSTDSPTGWRVDDISIQEVLSDDATLATFTLGGQDVTGLTNLEVADPTANEGATLYVDDFTDFQGIGIEATDVAASVLVELNGTEVPEGNLPTQALADGDVVVATVTAEDGSMAYYKVNITGENRELTLTGPTLPATFETGEDAVFTWTSANIANVNIYAVEPDVKGTANLINETPIDASLGTWTYTIKNGDFGTFTLRITDASDETFFNETASEATLNDTQAPARTAETPTAGATGQALSMTMSLTFDEDITAGVGNITVHNAADDAQVAVLDVTTGTVSGNELTIDVSGLSYNTNYYVLYDGGIVQDMAGNDVWALTDKTAWAFTTMEEMTGDLFFSEYIEGSSNNKALEIYNGTGADIDLSSYVIRINSNGGEWTSHFSFPEKTLANGEVYVIAHADAEAAILAEADTAVVNPYGGGESYVVVFNGNDVRALCKVAGTDTTIIDIIGRYDQVDPGSGWEVAGVADGTEEHTLVRKNSVTEGNTDWDASAGTNADDSEWIVYDQDEFSYIGMHGSTEPALTITAPEDGSTLYTTTVSVTFNVENFTVGDNAGGTDDGYVVYTLDAGTETNLFTTDAFDLSGLSLGEHTLNMWLADNNGVSLDPAVTYTVTFTIDEVQALSIYDIQYTTVEGDGTYPSLETGNTVSTSGIVTAVDEGTAFFIQDGAGAWNGIYVYDMNTVAEGDEVALTGEVVEYYGLTQLTNISSFEILSSGNTLPEATVVSTADANMEDYESVLVKVENAECTDADTESNYGMWTVNDGSGALLIDDDLYAFAPTATTNYHVTGVGFYSYSDSKILPRSAEDIEEAVSVSEITATAVRLYPNPANDVLFISSDSDVNRVEVYNLLGQNVMSTNIDSKQTELNVSDLDAGMYLIKVYDENGAQTHRFLKN
jgi:hypothetical protein